VTSVGQRGTTSLKSGQTLGIKVAARHALPIRSLLT
jgi:hypothetical protein